MNEEKKIYGASVLADDAQSGVSENEGKENFDEMKYTDEEIEDMRSDLKSGDTPDKVTEKVSTDALSGTRISTVEEENARMNKIEQDIIANDIRGKTLPTAAVNMIKTLVGVEYAEEDSARLAQFFEEVKPEDQDTDLSFNDIDILKIRTALGSGIMDLIETIGAGAEETNDITRRFVSQIYGSYHSEVKYNDDMRELVNITRHAREAAKLYHENKDVIMELDPNNPDDIKKGEETLDNLIAAKEWIEKFTSQKNKVQNQTKPKQDYTIDDLDAYVVDDIKEALNAALEMTHMYNFINSEGWQKEFNNIKDRGLVHKQWIKAIKNDTETLYTFPANEFDSYGDTERHTIDFIYSALIMEAFAQYIIPPSFTGKDPGEYYISEGICTRSVVNTFRLKAHLVLYVIAKTFKYKKVKSSVYERRVLSYTLDMMSKLGKTEYREKFARFADAAHEALISR